MRLLNTATSLMCAAALLACGTTTTVVKKDDVRVVEDTAKCKTNAECDEGYICDAVTGKCKEDLETIVDVAEAEAPEYVPGIPHEAQDAFRQGVQIAHEVPPQYDEALKKFEEAIALHAEFVEAYFNIAMVHERMRRPDAALSTYQRALKANPENADARAYIGKIYLARAKGFMELGRTNDALDLMKKGKGIFDNVVAQDYENVPANNALALYWLLQSKPDQAEDFVKQVLTIEPDNVTALNTRGLIFLQKNELDFARWIFEQKVLKLDANSIEAHTNLGTVFVRINDLPKAVKHFRRAVQLDPNNTAARMNLGAIYIDFLNYPGAKEEFEKVLSIQPDNVEAMIGMASADLGLGDMAVAITGYEAALKLDARRHILLRRIGALIEVKEGSTEAGLQRAITYYERYVAAAKLPPTDPLVRKIPVLKEVITSGMLRAPPVEEKPEGEEGEPKTPDAETAPDAEKKADEAPAAEPAEKKADEAPAAEPAPEKKADEAPAAEPAPEKKEEAAPAEKEEAAPAEKKEEAAEPAPETKEGK